MEPTTETPQLNNEDLVRAALNLQADEFVLGDRAFKVADLGYDDYLLFISLLSPFVDVVCSTFMNAGNITVPGISLEVNGMSASKFIALVGKQLPELAHLVCKQTDPTITVDEVKKLAKKPTALIDPVIKQIVQNNIIKDFSAFFGQAMGILRAAK